MGVTTEEDPEEVAETHTSDDLVQYKMSPTLSFSGMYQISFIYRRNRTNTQ